MSADQVELPEDFVRNFLFRCGMEKTFECFQQEWFERTSRGLITPSNTVAPDIYRINQTLSDELESLRTEVKQSREVTSKAQAGQEKMRKERDFHRLQHRRVLQEKSELLAEVKRLHAANKDREPVVAQLEAKYETLLRQNMLTTIDRDRAKNQVQSLQSTMRAPSTAQPPPTAQAPPTPQPPPTAHRPSMPATQRLTLRRETTMPVDGAPDLSQTQPLPTFKPLTPARIRSLAPGPAVSAHSQAISALAAHPTRNLVATGADDAGIALWEGPSGSLVCELEGHRGFVSALDFSAKGDLLASGSGDAMVKVWDVEKRECVATLAEHSHPVWGVAFHHTAAFLASGAMDSNVKLWDLATARSRATLRGHRDAVNTVAFQYLSNTLASGSADRTVALWDARTSLQTRVLRGHGAPVNAVVFSRAGDRFASSDSDGAIVLWDVRTLTPVWTSSAAQGLSVPRLAFDPSGCVLAAACEDGSVRIVETADGGEAVQLAGHADAVLATAIAASGDYVASSGADGVLRFWV